MYSELKRPPLLSVVAFALVGILLLTAWSAYQTRESLLQHQRALAEQVAVLEQAMASQAETNEQLELGVTELRQIITALENDIEYLSKRVLYTPLNRTVYLTFDDGPSQNTSAILDILKHYGVKATFFVTGNNSTFGRSMYKRIVEEGHALGNHTYSHNYSNVYASAEAYWAEHMRLEDLIFEATGVRPEILRFPGGSNNTVSHKYGGEEIMNELTQMVIDKGYRYIDWNVTSQDASVSVQDVEVIIEAVLSRVGAVVNPIILLHDSSLKTTTVEALPTILETLLDLGFRFDVLSPTSYSVRFQ